MNTELQNKVWSILPKEFKEEVNEIYLNAVVHHPCGYNHKTDLLKYLFGIHNLTSDAEGEEDEMLYVSRKKVQEEYAAISKELSHRDTDAEDYIAWNYMKMTFEELFGAKCLPDDTKDETKDETKEPKPAEPFKVGDKVRILSLHGMPTPDKGEVDVIAHINIGNREQMYYLENHYHCAYGFSESDLEPYTEPYTEPTAAKQDKNSFQNGNTSNYSGNLNGSQPVTGNHFADVRKMVDTRLHIAAMAMAGALANTHVTKNCSEFEDNQEYITKTALMYADALIAECEKGSDNK